MKGILILVSSLFIFSNTNAQWFWQNPLPQGNPLTSICFTDANTGWAVGTGGTIMKTTDGGSNWENQNRYDRFFDVIQHLGLLYHLRDPMLSLSQSRSCLRTGGHILIETGAVVNTDSSFMLFNNVPPEKQRIYKFDT